MNQKNIMLREKTRHKDHKLYNPICIKFLEKEFLQRLAVRIDRKQTQGIWILMIVTQIYTFIKYHWTVELQ